MKLVVESLKFRLVTNVVVAALVEILTPSHSDVEWRMIGDSSGMLIVYLISTDPFCRPMVGPSLEPFGPRGGAENGWVR